MDDDEKDRRVAVLVNASRTVLDMFRRGYNPTEAQLNAVEGGILGLTALKTCGHTVTEDCYCAEAQP